MEMTRGPTREYDRTLMKRLITISALTIVVGVVAVLLILGQQRETEDDRRPAREVRTALPTVEQDTERTPRQPELGGDTPGRRLTSPDGKWEAIVEEGTGLLTLHSIADSRVASTTISVASDVTAEVAFSPSGDLLVYPQRHPHPETDLMLISVPPSGEARVLTDWSGSEDLPVFSSDGKRLAFITASEYGISSIFVIDVDLGGASAVQVTNVGVKKGPTWEPGTPPPGFVPPPDNAENFQFEGNRLRWTSLGLQYSAEIPY